ncbi:S26 family signal peptidase [Sphingosinicella soli]|nr:S26 family signal peptidase [Sphingosinicella soli]
MTGAEDCRGVRHAARCGTARSRRVRLRALMLAGLGGGLLLTLVCPPRPRLVWNVSASAPVGLYAIGGRDAIAAGDMVLARVPARWRGLAAERRYIPANIPLVKRVAAKDGDKVCAEGGTVVVNGVRRAARAARDSLGRPMPSWSGCVTLRRGAYFLLMDDPASFDGRYFGPTLHGDIIGEAWSLWSR